MADPATLASLFVGGWSSLSANVFGQAIIGGYFSNATDRLVCKFGSAVRDRFAGTWGLPENHDLTVAVRLAQMHALEYCVRSFHEAHRHEWEAGLGDPHTAFFDRALGFCGPGGTGRHEDPKLFVELTEPLQRAFEALLAEPGYGSPSGERAAALGAFAENAVLAEFIGLLEGTALPAKFEDQFRNGNGTKCPCFLEMFGFYFARQIKEKARLHDILTTGQLARIEGLAFDGTEMLQQMLEQLDAIGRRLISIEDSVRSQEAVALATKQDTERLLAFAEEERQKRGIAEGFIHEMAGRIAVSEGLDLEGKKQAVRNAIGLYVAEIAGGTQTNLGDIVDEALARAKNLADSGKSGLARASLRQTAESLKHEEEERRSHYRQSVRTLYRRERDIAFAVFDAAAAAEVTLALADTLYPGEPIKAHELVVSEADTFYEYGAKQGSNVHLIACIELRKNLLITRSDHDDGGVSLSNLGVALWRLGERESGTARLEEAMAAYRAALEVRPRERAPLDWARTQMSLANVLWSLGDREIGTARLEEAVAAHRAALEEMTRDRVPFDWARTQMNLGNALWALGVRESGSSRLEEAVTAHRAALEERTRDRGPLEWALTQMNLGNALLALGRRESGAARLEEAVAAYRAALEERTRDRVRLGWAMTQMNLGNALRWLGERESGTTRLEEAVAAHYAALEERTRERVPLDWARTCGSLGDALRALGERESGVARLEKAVGACSAALEEWTRERVPLGWAAAQTNLGEALRALGERESGTARLEAAVAAHRAALEEMTRDRAPLDWATTQNNLGNALARLGERETGTAWLEEAVIAHRAAMEERTLERVPLDWARTQVDLGAALGSLGKRENDTARLEEALAALDAGLIVTANVLPPEWVRSVRDRRDAVQLEIKRRVAK